MKPQTSVGLVSTIHPIHPSRMTESLVHHMTSWVVERHIQPGSKLPAERDLAVMLRVSRGSLRQALKALEVMGVIQARQGSGTYLTSAAAQILRQPKNLRMPLSGVSFGELFEARRTVEAEAAAMAATRVTKRDVDGLRREIKRMEGHLGAPLIYLKHDMAFHHKIMLAAGNSVFAWFQELVVTVTRGALEARARVAIEHTFDEHLAILRAIEAKDPDAARAAMLEHLLLTKFYAQADILAKLHITALGGRPNRVNI